MADLQQTVYPHKVVTRQMQVERRTGKVRRSKTNVPPLYHATNQPNIVTFQPLPQSCEIYDRGMRLSETLRDVDEPWLSTD